MSIFFRIFYFLRHEVRYFFQRLFRGYDAPSVWGFDFYIAKQALPRLVAFKKSHVGYPCELTMEKWDEILDKMIFAMSKIVEDDLLFADEETNKKVDEGCELLGKYFRSLWD